MTTFMPPTPNEIDRWIRQDLEVPKCLMDEGAAAFEMIRMATLKRLMHRPEMWWQQAMNSLGGCLRHLVLIFVGIPTLHFWASLLPDAPGVSPAMSVPPGWMDHMVSDAAPLFLALIVSMWVLLVAADVIFLGGRIGSFRNVLGERAARIALDVWDRERHQDQPGRGPCHRGGRQSR
jgi:hypothetical protein